MISTIRLDLLAALGDEWISEHIANELRLETERQRFRVYVTDALYVISRRDQQLTRRYADLIAPVKEETRTAKQIINTIKDKLRKGGTSNGSNVARRNAGA